MDIFIYMKKSQSYQEVIGETIEQIRTDKGWTQEELADELGVSRITINRYINGQSIPSALMLKKISLVLNCDINEFFYAEY